MKKVEIIKENGSGTGLITLGKVIIGIGLLTSIPLLIWGIWWAFDGYGDQSDIGKTMLLYAPIILFLTLISGYILRGIGELVINSHRQLALKREEFKIKEIEIVEIAKEYE